MKSGILQTTRVSIADTSRSGFFHSLPTTWLNYTDFQYACVLVNPSHATPQKGRFLRGLP